VKITVLTVFRIAMKPVLTKEVPARLSVIVLPMWREAAATDVISARKAWLTTEQIPALPPTLSITATVQKTATRATVQLPEDGTAVQAQLKPAAPPATSQKPFWLHPVMSYRQTAARQLLAAPIIVALRVSPVSAADTDTRTDLLAAVPAPATEALQAVWFRTVEQLLILALQNVRGIANTPVQPEPAASIIATLPLHRIITVQEAALPLPVPAPFQLTMPEVLTSATKVETCTGAMA
jgi:hypothetical protein